MAKCTCTIHQQDPGCPLGLMIGNHPIGGQMLSRQDTMEGLAMCIKSLQAAGRRPALEKLLLDAYNFLLTDNRHDGHPNEWDIPF